MERPIIFNDAMVRAILSGAKTETRRPVIINGAPARGAWWDHAGLVPSVASGRVVWRAVDGTPNAETDMAPSPRGPFGVPGDTLWVREAWSLPPSALSIYYREGCARLLSSRDASANMESVNAWVKKLSRVAGPSVWAPSIHMPRWAARTVLDVLEVRVERLQDMSEEDALAEGFVPFKHIDTDQPFGGGDWRTNRTHPCTLAFAATWDAIYPTMSWASNPWVWVVRFKRQGGESEAARVQKLVAHSRVEECEVQP